MKNKKLGLWSAISIGIGGMVGAGIFSILGTACEIAGNAVYISFIIAGALALFSTYSYAKLSMRFPSAGGPVEFLIRGLGDNVLSGAFNTLLWVGYIFALALYARAFAAYALTFFPNSPAYNMNLISGGIIVLFTIVNFIGSEAMGKSELFIVTVKVGVLILFAGIGSLFIKPQLLSVSKWTPASSILFAAAVVFLAYEGFGLITNAAEDVKNPIKTIPRALYLSVIMVIMIYVGVSIAVIGNLPVSEIIKAKDYALAEAAKPFLGLVGFKAIAIAAMFSTASAINATLYGGANVSYIIAKYGELPRIFERKVWGKDIEGLFITAGLVILITDLFDLSKIAMLGSAMFLLIYLAVNIGHLRVYKRTKANPYIIWISILGSIIAFIVLAYYLVNTSMITLITLIAIFFASFLVEWIYRAYNNRSLKVRRVIKI